jgi:hypothetical protein
LRLPALPLALPLCLPALAPACLPAVVIEFSLNDNSTALYNSFERRSYELLLRQLLSLPGRPAVLLLHHYPWWRSGGDGLESGLYWKEPEGMLTMFSFYYDIPSLSLRTAAWHLMDAGVDGFKVGGRGRISGRGWAGAGAGAGVVWARLTRRHCQPALVGRSPCRCHGWTLLRHRLLLLHVMVFALPCCSLPTGGQATEGGSILGQCAADTSGRARQPRPLLLQ